MYVIYDSKCYMYEQNYNHEIKDISDVNNQEHN